MSEPKRYALNQRITKTTRDQLTELAADFGVPRAEVVRILIERASQKHRRSKTNAERE